MTRQQPQQNTYRALTAMVSASIALAGFSMFDLPAVAQGRNPGRGGGGGGGGGQSSPQRSSPPPSQPSQPSRSEPAPRREEPRPSPPVRNDPPRREEPRSAPPSQPSRSDPPPQRETYVPRRDPAPSQPRDESRSGRQDNTPRHIEPRSPSRDASESFQNPRRGDRGGDSTAPRRDPSTPRSEPRSEPRTTPGDSSPRGDQRPTRDPGTVRSDQRPQREQRDSSPADTRPSDQGPGNIFSRRNPTNRIDRIGDPVSGNQNARRQPFGDRTRDRAAGPGPIRSGALTYRDGTRSEPVAPQRDRARDIFTRSREGRYYNNGVQLRRGYYTPYREVGFYYPNYVFYPYYCPTYTPSAVYFSPYSFYYGVCAPYIYRRHAYYAYPSTIWIDIPIYVNNEYRGWGDDRRSRDDYYLNRSADYYDPDSVADPSLRDALDDIHDAFRYGSIEHLINLVDPELKVAVFLKGKYEYSVASNDYLDMTRDAMRNMDTIQFDFTRLRKRAMNVYVASGKHVYRNRDGQTRTVYVSFVLEKLRDRWTITQIGTSPDRIQEP